jgi:hypothetical protein
MHPKTLTGPRPNVDFHDAALLPGESYPDRFQSFTLKTLAVGTHATPAESWVDVEVVWGPPQTSLRRDFARGSAALGANHGNGEVSDALGRSRTGTGPASARGIYWKALPTRNSMR